jgi:hypothetical protein
LLVQGQTKTKQCLLSQAWCSLNEDTIDFLISNWVVANVMTESSVASIYDRNSGCIGFVWNILYLESTSIVTSWWSQWVVMAACYCYLWWCSWSDMLLGHS